MSLIEWVATGLGVLCVALGALRSVWTFPTAIGSVSLLGLVVWRQRLYSDAGLQLFFVAANVYGWCNWRRSQAEAGEVRVVSLSHREGLAWLLAGAVAALAWGNLMRAYTNASYPWWDAAITAASIAAQILMARRAWENWALWIAVDAASIPLYLLKGLWVFTGLYALYLLLSLWGLKDWINALNPQDPTST